MSEQKELIRRAVNADTMEQLAQLFGTLDENINTVCERTGASIKSMGTEITVSGTQEQVELAVTVIEKLIAMLRRKEKIDTLSAEIILQNYIDRERTLKK